MNISMKLNRYKIVLNPVSLLFSYLLILVGQLFSTFLKSFFPPMEYHHTMPVFQCH